MSLPGVYLFVPSCRQRLADSMNKAIVLSDRTQVPAIPGKYTFVPLTVPDLHQVVERRVWLPISECARDVVEQLEASGQARNWRVQHPRYGGFIGNSQAGYKFNEPSPRLPPSQSFRRQFIPDISYIDAEIWSRLTPEEKRMAFKQCIPVVVIELMSETDKIENLQDKVAKFINAGTREGDRVWIYNQGRRPYFDALAPIEFESHWIVVRFVTHESNSWLEQKRVRI